MHFGKWTCELMMEKKLLMHSVYSVSAAAAVVVTFNW